MRHPFASTSRRLIVWLLACLVPLQAMAAGVISATGAAHTHVPAAAARLVLDDFRRMPVRRVTHETHVATSFGHFHGSTSPERHHHAASDLTVVIDGAGLLQSGDTDDMSFSPSLGVFVGLISAPPRWLDAATPAVPISGGCWTLQTHHPDLPERPPRAS